MHSAAIDIPLKLFLSNAMLLTKHSIVTSESVDMLQSICVLIANWCSNVCVMAGTVIS